MKLPLAGSYSTDQLETFCPRNFETVASKIQQAGANTSWTFFCIFVLCSGVWPSVYVVLCLCVFRDVARFCFFFLIVLKRKLLNKYSVLSSAFLLFCCEYSMFFIITCCVCVYCGIVCCVATVLSVRLLFLVCYVVSPYNFACGHFTGCVLCLCVFVNVFVD